MAGRCGNGGLRMAEGFEEGKFRVKKMAAVASIALTALERLRVQQKQRRREEPEQVETARVTPARGQGPLAVSKHEITKKLLAVMLALLVRVANSVWLSRAPPSASKNRLPACEPRTSDHRTGLTLANVCKRRVKRTYT